MIDTDRLTRERKARCAACVAERTPRLQAGLLLITTRPSRALSHPADVATLRRDAIEHRDQRSGGIPSARVASAPHAARRRRRTRRAHTRHMSPAFASPAAARNGGARTPGSTECKARRVASEARPGVQAAALGPSAATLRGSRARLTRRVAAFAPQAASSAPTPTTMRANAPAGAAATPSPRSGGCVAARLLESRGSVPLRLPPDAPGAPSAVPPEARHRRHRRRFWRPRAATRRRSGARSQRTSTRACATAACRLTKARSSTRCATASSFGAFAAARQPLGAAAATHAFRCSPRARRCRRALAASS